MNIENSNKNSTNGAYNGGNKELEDEVRKLLTAVNNREMRYTFPKGFSEEVKNGINTKVKTEVKNALVKEVKDDMNALKREVSNVTTRVKEENNKVIENLKNVNRVIDMSNERRHENISKIEKMQYLLHSVRDITIIGVFTVLLVVGIATSIVLINAIPDFNFFLKALVTIGGLVGLWVVVVLFNRIIEWWSNR